jgi:hypothetical protein
MAMILVVDYLNVEEKKSERTKGFWGNTADERFPKHHASCLAALNFHVTSYGSLIPFVGARGNVN